MKISGRDMNLGTQTHTPPFYQVMYPVTLFNINCLIPLPLYQFYTWPKINKHMQNYVYIYLSFSFNDSDESFHG